MSGIGIIINPYSRANRSNPKRAEQFGFIVGDRGTCHRTKDLKDVERLAREFKERGVEILGISGGDGTNHVTLSTFLDVYGDEPLPKIAFLRGGTMNNLANELGIKGKSEKILSNLILKYHHGDKLNERDINLMKINGKYGFIFGMGVVTEFTKVYHSKDGYPSPQRAAWILLHCILSGIINGKFVGRLARRFEADIFCDGKKTPFVNWTMLVAGTIKNLGLGFNAIARAYEDPEKFHFIGMSDTPRGIIKQFPRALMSKPFNSEHFFDEICKELVIKLPKEMTYTIDGDMFDDKEIKITLGPKIRCIIP
ncbi:MAG: diacylglycerol kinase family protein [Pseudomonadota bacterium]